MALQLMINGQPQEFDSLGSEAKVADLISAMELKGDRIAVEVNHEIAPRGRWAELELRNGDRLEIVHFVGGGSGSPTE